MALCPQVRFGTGKPLAECSSAFWFLSGRNKKIQYHQLLGINSITRIIHESYRHTQRFHERFGLTDFKFTPPPGWQFDKHLKYIMKPIPWPDFSPGWRLFRRICRGHLSTRRFSEGNIQDKERDRCVPRRWVWGLHSRRHDKPSRRSAQPVNAA